MTTNDSGDSPESPLCAVQLLLSRCLRALYSTTGVTATTNCGASGVPMAAMK